MGYGHTISILYRVQLYNKKSAAHMLGSSSGNGGAPPARRKCTTPTIPTRGPWHVSPFVQSRNTIAFKGTPISVRILSTLNANPLGPETTTWCKGMGASRPNRLHAYGSVLGRRPPQLHLFSLPPSHVREKSTRNASHRTRT